MTIMNEATALVNGDRNADYGDPVENLDRIARLWSVVLGVSIPAEKVAICMILMKLSRLCHTPSHHDTIVDIAGYAEVMNQIAIHRHPLDIRA